MSNLFIPTTSPKSGKIKNVTNAAGYQYTFSDPYSNDNDPTGDYNLDIHCYVDGDPTSEEGEVSYYVKKTPEGFFIRPSADCALVTFEVSDDTEPNVEA